MPNSYPFHLQVPPVAMEEGSSTHGHGRPATRGLLSHQRGGCGGVRGVDTGHPRSPVSLGKVRYANNIELERGLT